MSKMKILTLCDAPTLSSGFARVAANLLRRWHSEAEIDCWGVGFVGWGYRRAPFVDTMYPAGPDWATQAKLELFLAQLRAGAYTHLWMMEDTFLLAQGDFPRRLREVCAAKRIHSTLYFPVDAALDPSWTDIIAAVDCAVAYTAYGKQEAEAKGRLRGHGFNCEVLPHGVDTTVYQPQPDRARLRQAGGLWDQDWVKPDDFLMLNVNANQRRKDVVRSLEVLVAVRKLGVPAKLLMHKPDESGEGLSLTAAAEQLGLEALAHWAHSDPLFRRGNALLTEVDLVRFYNVADLYLTTTLGEGWGLGITEALGCGCPVALPLHTACAELHDKLVVTGRVVGLPLEPHGVVCDWDNSRVRRRVDVDGAAKVIADYYHNGAWKERPELPALVEQWLSWDRVAAKMLRLMKRRAVTVQSPPLYLEYGGGLGDVLSQLFYRGSYDLLKDLRPEQRAKVAIISHNPFVPELFAWHPKRSQIEVVDCGYWQGQEADAANRKRLGLPPPGALGRLPADRPTPKDLEFYPSPEDQKILSEVLPGGQVVVLAPAAGLPDRNIPPDLAREVIRRLTAVGYRLVLTGRRYDRHGREEMASDGLPWPVVDLVDKLSVPGTCALVQASAGLVTCHSALNLLAWHLRKPQLLLYPRSAWERHMRKPDQWAFGIAYPETVHAAFEDCRVGGVEWLVERFAKILGSAPLSGAVPTAGGASGR